MPKGIRTAVSNPTPPPEPPRPTCAPTETTVSRADGRPAAFPLPTELPPGLPRFAEQWSFKMDLCGRFQAAWGIAQRTIAARGLCSTLPESLYSNWLAIWLDSSFFGFIPAPAGKHEELSRSLADVNAMLEALEIARRHPQLSRTCPALIVEFPESHTPGRGILLSEREALEDWRMRSFLSGTFPNLSALECLPTFGLTQFFERASFLLNTPEEADWCWLHRLAVRIDKDNPVWDNPPRFELRSREVFGSILPSLSRLLRVKCPDVSEPAIPFWTLVNSVQNWVIDAEEKIRELSRTNGADDQENARDDSSTGDDGEANQEIPEWVHFHFRQKQYRLLRLLCQCKEVSERDLIRELAQKGSRDPEGTLKKTVNRAKDKLCDMGQIIGEQLTIHQRQRAGTLYYYLGPI